jgi:hypothetical protein
MIELPFTTDPSQSFDIQLGDAKYTIAATFSERTQVWSMDISDFETKDVIIQGVPLVLGTFLLNPYNLGIGDFLVVDTAMTNQDAGADDLGDRVKVYWQSEDELKDFSSDIEHG